jgi:hypothetical protein
VVNGQREFQSRREKIGLVANTAKYPPVLSRITQRSGAAAKIPPQTVLQELAKIAGD